MAKSKRFPQSQRQVKAYMLSSSDATRFAMTVPQSRRVGTLRKPTLRPPPTTSPDRAGSRSAARDLEIADHSEGGVVGRVVGLKKGFDVVQSCRFNFVQVAVK